MDPLEAWNNPGPVPSYHHKMQEKLRKEWPALANALDGRSEDVITVGLRAREGHTHAKLVDYVDNSYEALFFPVPGATYTHHGIKRPDGVWLWFGLPHQTFSPRDTDPTYRLTVTLSRQQYRDYMEMWIEQPHA